jgi:hypothetical protein
MKLLNIKKKIKPDTCAVMRCKSQAVATTDARQVYPDRQQDAAMLPLCAFHLNAMQAALHGPAQMPAVLQPSEQTGALIASAQGSLQTDGDVQADEGVQAMLAVLADRAVRDKVEGDLRKKEQTLITLRSLPIRDQRDIDSADSILRHVKAKLKWYKDEKIEARRPFNKQLERVSNWFNPAIEFYSEAERIVKARIRDGRAELEKARVVALQSVQGAHQAGDMRTVQAMVQTASAAETHLPKGMHQIEHYSFQINAPDLVPRDFCSPDPAKIRAHAQRYGTSLPIPGVTIWPDDTMVQRK